ncbi:kelch-like protein 10 [Eleginops maclovinus]|uniref:kelch-like protein 10 n=1 Tax=Eleginops maclovinus TaxID=56733 RepID=UPI00308098D9
MHAHKVILCGCSSYFRVLLTKPLATTKKQKIFIPGVSLEMMRLIIDYAYTNSTLVTEDNVEELLAAADQLFVTGLFQSCWFFLEDQLCPGNCIGIWRLMSFYYMPEDRKKVFHYILHSFKEIVSVSEELVDLSMQQLTTIIESDHLNVSEESTVFEAILSWINHQPDQRSGHIFELLSKVRLGLMNFHYLQNVMENDVVKKSSKCFPMLDEALKVSLDYTRHSTSIYKSPLSRPRLPSTILLVTGGEEDGVHATELEAYDARADCWTTISDGQIRRAYHGAAFLNNFVYLIGGIYNHVYLNNVKKFDIVTRTWHQVAPMNYCRGYVCVVEQNECIYAIGGYNGVTCFNSVECYRPETDRWTMVAQMNSRRGGAGATTLNGKVYVCGGNNGNRDVSTAECYDPDINQWTKISSMKISRSGLGVAAYRNRIYAVGGTTNMEHSLLTVEAYNPETNKWSCTPSMRRPCSYFDIEVVDDQLFLVGGYNGSSTVSDVNCYDDEAGMWYDFSLIKKPRSGLSCCVLQGLNSMAEDLFPRGALMLPNVEDTPGASI